MVWTEKADRCADSAEKVAFLRNIMSAGLTKEGLHRETVSISLLMSIYKLLQFVCVETAHRGSRHLRRRVKILIGNLDSFLSGFEREVRISMNENGDCYHIKDLTRCLLWIKDFCKKDVVKN